MVKRFVIIGGGISGMTAAQTLREYDSACSITVYTNEVHPIGLYARKDQARRLAEGPLDAASLTLLDEAALAQQRIQFIYDPVLRVFAQRSQVLINHSIRKDYDTLLIATGATPRLTEVPGAHVLGVHQARLFEDFSFIENWMKDIQAGGAVVVGGGVLGMDMAYALTRRGVPVTLVARENELGAPHLSSDQAAAAKARLRERGVAVVTGQTVDAYVSQDNRILDGVRLSDGRVLQARMALCCIGVHPNTDFLEDSGLELDETSGALLVNDHMQTRFANIYAAGGCALVNGLIAYNWALCAEQGRTAALNMLGQPATFTPPAAALPVLPLVLEPALHAV